MALDKNGKPLQAGDKVIIRALVEEVTDLGERHMLKVAWSTAVPLTDYILSSEVELLEALPLKADC